LSPCCAKRNQAASVFRTEDLLHDLPDVVQVFVADLHEHASARMEQFASEQQAIAEIRQVRVQSEFPRVPVGLDHLGLTRQVRVVVVLHIAFADERLEIRAELHAVGRVDVDHLHLAAEPLVLEQRVHDDERVAEDEPILPLVLVLVRLEHLVRDRVLRVGEQVEHRQLLFARVGLKRFEDRLRREAFVNEEGQRRNLERLALGLARPVQERARQRPQPLRRLADRADLHDRLTPRVLHGRGEDAVTLGQTPLDEGEEPLPLLAGRVLTVPLH